MFKITYTFVLEPRGKEKWKKKSKLNCYMLKGNQISFRGRRFDEYLCKEGSIIKISVYEWAFFYGKGAKFYCGQPGSGVLSW